MASTCAGNILQNYDEFTTLKALQKSTSATRTRRKPSAAHYLDDEKLAELQILRLPAERKIQDYRSAYNDIRTGCAGRNPPNDKDASTVDWEDVVFEVDLLKSQEINLDYILGLIFEHKKEHE